MNFDGLRVGGCEIVFKKLPISRIWSERGLNSRARGHHLKEHVTRVRDEPFGALPFSSVPLARGESERECFVVA